MIKRGRPPEGDNADIALIDQWRAEALFAGILTHEAEAASFRLQASIKFAPQKTPEAQAMAHQSLSVEAKNFRKAAGDQQSQQGSR